MPLNVDDMIRAARLAGFEWSASELEPIRPAVERALESLARLERLGPEAPEPATLYRVV